MTSPRQRKKRLAFKRMKEKLEQNVVTDHKPVVVQKQAEQQKQEPTKPVAQQQQAVVESVPDLKPKKAKIGLTELKPQVQLVEQPKEEVKTETKE